MGSSPMLVDSLPSRGVISKLEVKVLVSPNFFLFARPMIGFASVAMRRLVRDSRVWYHYRLDCTFDSRNEALA